MAQSNIEWTDRVWNPVTGCSKVSAGCKNCYAEVMHKRLQSMGQEKYLQPFNQVKIWPDVLELPLKWKKPQKIFVNSMSDLFHPAVPFEFIAQVYDVMVRASQHTFQVLTKRPERVREFFIWLACKIKWTGHDSIPTKSKELFDYLYFPDNIWWGTSISTQKDADKNIPELLKIPGTKWLSIEPMLEHIDITGVYSKNENGWLNIFPLNWKYMHNGMNEPAKLKYGGINWVVVGGESGKNARPLHPEWVRSIRDQCEAAPNDVGFFFKQWGEYLQIHKKRVEHLSKPDKNIIKIGEDYFIKVGKKEAGCLLDGVEYKEFPIEYPF
jgi:protein gp37